MLKTLVMKGVTEDKGVLEISIPSVCSLKLSGHCGPITIFQLSNVSSLVDAALDLKLDIRPSLYYDIKIRRSPHECQDKLRKLLEKVNYAGKLTLGSSFVQVLSLLEVKALSSPSSNHNRKFLTVATGFDGCDLLGVTSLLDSFQYLEKLVIKFNDVIRDGCDWFDRDDLQKFSDIDEKNFWAAKERSFECLLMNLKTVEIVLKPQYWVSYAGLYEFAKFILGSARVLERMVLVHPEKFSDSKMRDFFYGVAQKLLTFPRSSPHAVVPLPELEPNKLWLFEVICKMAQLFVWNFWVLSVYFVRACRNLFKLFDHPVL